MTQSSHSTPDQLGADEPTGTTEEKLMVAVRVRPWKSEDGPRAVHVINEKVLVLEEESDKRDVLRQNRATERQYTYDRVFGEDATEEEVYQKTTAGLVEGALRGYTGAVFAYGATGAGKTHTMSSLMARALHHLFEEIKKSERPKAYEVKLSYIEIYNENIRDLLNPGSGFLELREDSGNGRGLAVAGLTEAVGESAGKVTQLLEKGNAARTAESTDFNQASSRGHALLSVTVTLNKGSTMQRGRLFLIDLAGSEKAGISRGRRQEGAHINRSLLALGNCINALSGGARYVNYRDSKLTRLLREALSGRCRTVMVAHVAPGYHARDTTRSTLTYAKRASTITNKVGRELMETPVHMSQYRTVISELREEIARLKIKMKTDTPNTEEMAEKKNVSTTKTSKKPEPENTAQLKQLRQAIVSTFKEQMRLRRKLMELDSHLLGLGLDAERQHAVISHWEARFNRLYKPIATSTRLSTQQSYRGGTVGAIPADGIENAEAEIEKAWAELAAIEREQEHTRQQRERVRTQLEAVRLRGAKLEQELPSRITSGSERETLALVCRIHELEADKLALQGERAARGHELRRRDLALQRRERQRQLADDIITKQRRTLDEHGIIISSELQELYGLYQQEIHAATYTESRELQLTEQALPPISADMREAIWTSGSSSGSGRGSSSGSVGGSGDTRLPALTQRQRPPYSEASASTLKRANSDDSIVTAPLRERK